MKKVLNWVVLFCVSLSVFGGSLEPSGPPAGTMKPLDQVEPRIAITSVPLTISQSGSYYLTKNLTATDTAITIIADDVTIDFCGFTLTGPGTIGYGIFMNGRKNVEVRNGTIKNFGWHGISEAAVNSGQHHRVVNMRILSCGNCGIYLSGNGHMIKDCAVSGIHAPSGGYITALSAGSACIITGNAICNNGTSAAAGSDVAGINAGNGCTIIGNVVSNNGTSGAGMVYGISVGNACVVNDNSVYLNGNNSTGSSVRGIYASGYTKVVGNCVYNNGTGSSATRYGIYLGGYNFVDQNIAYSNGTNMNSSATGCVIGQNVAP